MASDESFVKYVIDQIKTDGIITYKKMFGEYLIYLNKKPVITVCDNTPFVKTLDCVKPLLEKSEKGFPYDGAKEHYILDIENKELSIEVVKTLERNISIPKLRKKNKNLGK
jgi:TfoX/Sxy family transcriptional regulator of competence genes